ncbi:MAG: hypothetical protein J2P23_05080 [Microlunatus sp.]|nr:hypothetical protein [Microlunatus sp.]
MARYLILIYGSQARWDANSPAEWQQIDEGHRAFRAKAGTAVLASGELESSETATTLRGIDQGRPVITDGPYAESKETLGGFYVVRAADLDEAISYASVLAEVGHDHSCVEVRPLVDHGE